jgi:hypothetical protein
MSYSLGPREPITTTTEPNTETPKPLRGDVTVYVVTVNEEEFYEKHWRNMWNNIEAMVTTGCTLHRTHLVSCRSECSMTQEPDRGCVTFGVTLQNSVLCPNTSEQLRQGLEKK